MVTNISHSAEETAALGRAVGSAARKGQVFALTGDLGAGKTQWVRGFAIGLGVSDRVHSPTFALINEYAGGRLALFHLDLYRLEQRAQIHEAGLDDYLAPPGVTVVEWAEHWFGKSDAPAGTTWIAFSILGETARKITYEGPGY